MSINLFLYHKYVLHNFRLKIEKYNFLNIDIQGAELLALKGAGNILKKLIMFIPK